MFGYSFMNRACLLRRLAEGASMRDFVICYLSAGVFCACPITSVMCDYWGEPLVLLGYSRTSTFETYRVETARIAGHVPVVIHQS